MVTVDEAVAEAGAAGATAGAAGSGAWTGGAEADMLDSAVDPVKGDYRVRDGDRISVYPVFEAFDIAPVSPLRAKPTASSSPGRSALAPLAVSAKIRRLTILSTM